MSQYVYPNLQGKSIEIIKTPMWKSIIQETVSGKEVRTKLWSYPKYKILLKYNFLTDQKFNIGDLNVSDYEELVAFYNKVGGSYENFLFLDSIEYGVTDQVIGIADNVETQFQLVRTITGQSVNYIEPIYAQKTMTNVKVNDIIEDGYSINHFGLITFNSAPVSGNITWTGEYYFRVRFNNDDIEFNQFLTSLYSCDSVELITVKI